MSLSVLFSLLFRLTFHPFTFVVFQETIKTMMNWIFSLTEKEIIIYLAYAMIASGIITFLYMTISGQRATYGRYGNEAFFNQVSHFSICV